MIPLKISRRIFSGNDRCSIGQSEILQRKREERKSPKLSVIRSFPRIEFSLDVSVTSVPRYIPDYSSNIGHNNYYVPTDVQQYGGPGGSQSITNPSYGYNAANTVSSAAANANANYDNAGRGANANANDVSYTGASPATNYYSPGYDLSDTGANANTNLKSVANNGAGILEGYYTPGNLGANAGATASADAKANSISGIGSSGNYYAPGGSQSNGGAIADAKTNIIDGVTSGYKPGMIKSDAGPIGNSKLNGGVELPNGYYSSGTRNNAVTGSKV